MSTEHILFLVAAYLWWLGAHLFITQAGEAGRISGFSDFVLLAFWPITYPLAILFEWMDG